MLGTVTTADHWTRPSPRIISICFGPHDCTASPSGDLAPLASEHYCFGDPEHDLSCPSAPRTVAE